jgi:hypothetical protein
MKSNELNKTETVIKGGMASREHKEGRDYIFSGQAMRIDVFLANGSFTLFMHSLLLAFQRQFAG